jgi:DnaJ-class molecular chaperone
VFCGKYDCYKILGFDHETWGKSPPDKKDITQSYRTMSKRWHPDKTKDAGAEERFMVRVFVLFFDCFKYYV